MKEGHSHNFGLRFSEIILIVSGVLILANALVVLTGGSFVLWTASKIVYALGVIMLLVFG